MTVKRYHDRSAIFKKGDNWYYPSISPIIFDEENVTEIHELPFSKILSIESNDISYFLTPVLEKSSNLKVSFVIKEENLELKIGIASPSAFTSPFRDGIFAHFDEITGKSRTELGYDVSYVKAWEIGGSDYVLWDVQEDPGQYHISFSNDSEEPIKLEVMIEKIKQKDLSHFTHTASFATIKEDTVIEREVLFLPIIPVNCHFCGATLNPKNLEWANYNTVVCSNCGSSNNVKFERV